MPTNVEQKLNLNPLQQEMIDRIRQIKVKLKSLPKPHSTYTSYKENRKLLKIGIDAAAAELLESELEPQLIQKFTGIIPSEKEKEAIADSKKQGVLFQADSLLENHQQAIKG